MKKYCLDTSGLSTPFETMPADIYMGLWSQIENCIARGIFAATTEIYDELVRIGGNLGQVIRNNESQIRLEIGFGNWNYDGYLSYIAKSHPTYEPYINGTGGSRASLSFPDFSIVMLAKTLSLPVISMEIPCAHQPNSRKRKIPDICVLEGVKHMTFNEFLRAEGIILR
jgi:hypothetical protein